MSLRTLSFFIAAFLFVLGCTADFSIPESDAGELYSGGSDTETESGVDTETESGVDTGTESGVDTGTESGVDTETESGVDTETYTDTATGPESTDEDECPDDPLKTEPGLCGCGVSDVDSDGDEVPDCMEECDAGWTGDDCSQNIDDCTPDPCENGTCTDGVDSYTCTCDAGWTGAECNQNINDCASNPCLHGMCTDDLDSYTCSCEAGWTGANCNSNIDDCSPSPCVNGTCIDGINAYTCSCDPGWMGTLCDQVIQFDGIYEAEDRTAEQDASETSSSTGYMGTGYMDYGGDGAWIEWKNVIVPVSGSYRLEFRYATAYYSRPCTLFINGVDHSLIPFKGVAGASWDDWRVDTVTVLLPAGTSTIRVTSVGAGPNLDRMTVTGDD